MSKHDDTLRAAIFDGFKSLIPEDIEVRPQYNNVMRHAPKTLTTDEMILITRIKDKGLELYELLDNQCPQSREVALAKTKVEEAVMWAVKSITA